MDVNRQRDGGRISHNAGKQPTGSSSDKDMMAWLAVFILFGMPFSICSTSCLQKSTTTTYLDCIDENIGILTANKLCNMQLLKSIKFTQTSIYIIDEDVFQCLEHLESLVLQKNNFSTLPLGVFRSQLMMQYLYLEWDKISTLHLGLFDPLESLKQLSLQGNKLSVLKPGIFSKLTSLEHLNLGCE